MIFKGGTLGFVATICALFFLSKIGLLLPVLFFFLRCLTVMVDMFRHSARDFDNAQTVFGTVSAFFGWTHASKVATGERPLNFGLLDGAVVGSILGLMVALLAQDLMSKGDAL